MSSLDFDKIILNEVRTAIGTAISTQLGGYSSPLVPAIKDAISKYDADIRCLINEAIGTVMADKEFRNSMIEQIRHKVAKELTQAFGEGIFAKTINSIKSDQMIKARCIIAIENIINKELKTA